MKNIGTVSIGGADSLFWNEDDPNGKHVAVESDNKATWYATVYATYLDYVNRTAAVKYKRFGFRSQSVTWACKKL